MEIATWAALAALATKLMSFVKLALARDRGAITQLAAWAIGVAIMFIGASAELTSGLTLPGTDITLGSLDVWSLIIAGLTLGSVGSLTRDSIKAVDNTSSAAEPPLVKPKP